MPAQWRWHYIGYPLPDLSVDQVLLLPNSSTFHLREYCGQTVSCPSQQQVESLLLAYNGCIKVLSAVGKQCGLTEAQRSVVNGAVMECLVQQ